ncbi:MAG: bifunctional DNA-formamidopyrimidine glycosylase/DNA-(apurinic or apyrimidinic site) lyase [Alphaproteobacteria bacterium]|nr:bifunctional DNA-formamidopyrimidine glycosylase/DNA-(apurinic or apyrimidinic site) lyase [Alphaproteobacteria bacterium]
MPELPEVETIKNAVAKGIGKAKILSLEVRNSRLREEVPADIAQKIVGATIRDYRRIAKYIVVDLDNGLSLIWHMGMSGKVKITDSLPDLEKHDHIIILTTNGYIIYNDPRRFGLFSYVASDELFKNRYFAKLGADPFDEKLNAEYLYDKLHKHLKAPIKISLLDQTIIAGIGNIYASEILYESRISPIRESGKISLEECDLLIKNTRKVLQKAIKAGGSTLRDYKKPNGSMGYFQQQHCVYNKTGLACPDCKCDIIKTKGIRRIVQGGRSTFYCESLQK